MELKLNELAYIGKLFDKITDISLFRHIVKPLEGDEAKNLEDMNVIKRGKLTEPINQIFEVIAGAQRASRLIINMPDVVMEKSVYTKDGTKVLVENKGGKADISILDQEMDRIRFEISEHLGMSMQQHSTFNAIFSADELLMILSIVDWVRRESMLSYISYKESDPLTENALADYLNAPMNNGLLELIKKTFDLGHEKYSIEDLRGYLSNFAERNLLSVNDREISLNRELMDFSLNFCIIESQVLMEAFQMNTEGNIKVASVLSLTAGVKDLVAFTPTDEGIEMDVISSSTLINWIESYLKCPEL